jgi:hypothetical protein
MTPNSPTDAERKVIRWFFGIALIVAIVVVTWGWLSRRHECITSCEAKGFASGCLRLNAGGRFNLGTHCVCER